MSAAASFVREQMVRYSKMNKDDPLIAEKPYADFCQALLAANEFVYID